MNQNTKGKTILFGAPKTYNISIQIIENLKAIGFNVIDASFEQKYKYKSVKDRLVNFFRKTFLNDKNYKNILRFNVHRDRIIKEINDAKPIDYALFIRPDLFPIDFIQSIRSQVGTSIAYQWDGMNRFEHIKNYIHLFDRFFVFDEVDLKDGFLPTTNFYFDYHNLETTNAPSNIVYFIGAYVKDRYQILPSIVKEIYKAGFTPNINICNGDKKQIDEQKYEGIKVITDIVSFEDNLKQVKSCDVLLDLLNNIHNGLSFRVFESIGYQKKLLTNNPYVKQFDFYNENNIFVFDENNLNLIPEFLQKPYQPLPHSIREKYSFSNWIRYILDIEPYQSIDLPKFIP
ncbi:hypothetical protein JSO62_04455 [Riemerella anatipestifer]|uniref:hypothetical protein n=1 Tax=Riemerella anatipestifer TaxID=34085 RepID=UPI0030C3FDC7